MQFIQQFFPQQNYPSQSRRMHAFSDSLMALNAMSCGRYDMENGNKILLPQSALQQVLHVRQSGPMIFRLTNTVNNKVIYVGVLEFVAEEGTCVIPNWLFEGVGMFEGCQVMIALVPALTKGKLIKLQPHETAFIDLPDPRAVLETSLRNHVCLTEGSTITVSFSGKHYQIDIVKITPQTPEKAVGINDADVEIDFAPPLDYEEAPPNLLKKPSSTFKAEDSEEKQQGGFNAFQGKGFRLDGKPEGQQNRKASDQVQQVPQAEPYNPRKHRLNHGVKTQIENQSFQGKPVSVPWSKSQLK